MCWTVVVQEHGMTCAGPRCNATPNEHCLHTSHCTLHTPHSTLHTCTSPHLNSSHMSSSHLMSCLPICQLSSSSLFSFHLSTAQPSHLTEASLNSSRLFCTSESLRHRCIYTEEVLQNTLYYKACAKHFPVLLCTTKLAQSASQYYFVRLHKIFPTCIKLYTQQPFTHSNLLQREAFTHNKLLHTASVCTQQSLTETFSLSNLFTQKVLHRATFYTSQFYTQKLEKLLHTASFYTQQAFTHSKL